MGKTIVFWVLGLYISLFLGGFFTALFRRYMIDADSQTDTGEIEKMGDRTWIFGSLERLFFTLAAAISVGGAVIAMMIWLAMKNSNLTLTGVVIFILALVATAAGGLYWKRDNT